MNFGLKNVMTSVIAATIPFYTFPYLVLLFKYL